MCDYDDWKLMASPCQDDNDDDNDDDDDILFDIADAKLKDKYEFLD